MQNFWMSLPKPFFVLAPMEDVTDTVFRQIVASVGRPHVFFTEFTNVEGILSRGYESVTRRLKYTESERPIVAQIWGTDPEKFKQVAKILKEMDFDGIDLNFGCPERSIVKNGACSALIGNYNQVSEIISATHEGAGGLPVSVKTRIGIKKPITEEWADFLLEQGLSAITIHGRTAAEMSAVPAHWDEIAKVTAVKKQKNSSTLIIGNGDVKDLQDALQKQSDSDVDGIMIGRGIFENVAVFSGNSLTQSERMKLLVEHAVLYEKTWGDKKSFQIMKKFVKAYINGFPGAVTIREKLMQANSVQELVSLVSSI